MSQPSSVEPTVVDLRSDTITKPDPVMRTAMAEAEVGDDVYGEDPTVNSKPCSTCTIYVPSNYWTVRIGLSMHTNPYI